MTIARSQMYRQLRQSGGITNAVPRKGYFLGDIADSVGDFLGDAAGKVGDVVGSVADKVDLKDAAALAALVSGNPQLAASIYSAGGGTGNEFIDTGLQIYGASGATGKPESNNFMNFLQQPTSKEIEKNTLSEILKQYGQDQVKEKGKKEVEKTVTQRILDSLLSPEGIVGLTGAYLGYKDQKRVNEELQKRYENFRRAEEAKYKQYRTGEGLRGMTVSNRTAQQMGTGIMGLDVRTNPEGVQEIDYRENGGFVPPIGIKEKADDIPAMLSNNEFVFTADAVRGAGNGDVKEGARKMYAMMKQYEGNQA